MRISFHHPFAECPFLHVELNAHIQGMSENVLDFVPVHNAHPFAPQVCASSLQQK